LNFKAEKDCFLKNGKPYFLISGEIHYFRLNPKLWEKHLRLLKESGANTTSTYIPWDWHEYEEGKFDFSGETNPARNLLRYIELCKNIGLNLIVKPGPYILAEYENHGLPNWLSKKCSKNAFVLDENKNVVLDKITVGGLEVSRYTTNYLKDASMGFKAGDIITDIIVPVESGYLEITLLDNQYMDIYNKMLKNFQFLTD